MIDKILDFKEAMPTYLFKKIMNSAIDTKNARIIFLLAYYVKKDILKLSEEILKTNNLRYISFFMRSIPNIDKQAFVDKTLELGSGRDAYYCLFDNRDLSDESVLKLVNKCKESQAYYFLSMYHYFITLGRFNISLFEEIKDELNKSNIMITEDNYREILWDFKEKVLNNSTYEVKKKFSNNRYKGRKDYIPDIIVLHSTASFSKGIRNFYDEEKEVSAHFFINTDGFVQQIVSLDDSAWANGTSLNEESDVYYRFATNELVSSRNYNANYYTFSIENASIDGELTDEQYNSLKEVIKKIIKYVKETYNYDFMIDDKHIVGHRDINPIVRTVCPGNKFPMNKLIEDLNKEI